MRSLFSHNIHTHIHLLSRRTSSYGAALKFKSRKSGPACAFFSALITESFCLCDSAYKYKSTHSQMTGSEIWPREVGEFRITTDRTAALLYYLIPEWKPVSLLLFIIMVSHGIT
jgi:hypothetical protein